MDQKRENLRGMGWPNEAIAFLEMFASAEGAMKRGKFANKNKVRAEADWGALAAELKEEFFVAIRDSKKASTLIETPPKKFMRDTGWQNDQPAKIESVRDLFVRGVCMVRNNLGHGDKYIGTDEDRKRDAILITEATYVLRQALVNAQGKIG